MDSLLIDSSEWDIYQAVSALTELRELSRRFPGRSVYAKLVSRVYNWKETHSVPSVDTAFEQHKAYTLNKIRRKRDGHRAPSDNVEVEQSGDCDVDAQQGNAERDGGAEEKKREDEVDSSAAQVPKRTHASHPARPPPRLRAAPASRAAPRRAIVREVIKEVLPALLLQQQALMGSAFSAMGSSAAVDSNGEDGALSYGCRNCDTLQRQVEELQGEVSSLKAAALTSAAASDSRRAVLPVEEDGEVRECYSPSPSDSDADRSARRQTSSAASHADNRADAQSTIDPHSALDAQEPNLVYDSQPADENYNSQPAEAQPSTCPTTSSQEQQRQQQQQRQHTRASSTHHFTPEHAQRCVWVQSRYSIHAAELGEVMSHFGPVEEVVVIKPAVGTRPFAYVYFVREEDAASVLKRAERREFEYMVVRPYRCRAGK